MQARDAYPNEIRALIVEDHAVIQKIEVLMLKKFCKIVDAASTAAQALLLLSEHRYDIIYMDIGLPDMDGLTLTDKIRHSNNENQKTPIIALSAHSDNDYQDKAVSVGMNGYIVKPMVLEDLQENLQAFVSNKTQDH